MLLSLFCRLWVVAALAVFRSSRVLSSVLAWCAAAFAGMLQLWMMISAFHANRASFLPLCVTTS